MIRYDTKNGLGNEIKIHAIGLDVTRDVNETTVLLLYD